MEQVSFRHIGTRGALTSVLLASVILLGGVASASEWANDARTGCAVWHGHPNPPANTALTWSGSCDNGRGSGTGTFVVSAEGKEIARYEGPLVEGKPHGSGSFKMPGGSSYEGEFRDGKFNGNGILISGGGIRYEGEFKDGTMHGRGVLTMDDGARFEGEFRNGMPAGQ